MYIVLLNTERLAKVGISITLCLLAIYLATTAVDLKDTLADDKSTSITCTGSGPCEKTECINGDCDTTATNSSNITSIHGRENNDGKDNNNPRRSILEEKLGS